MWIVINESMGGLGGSANQQLVPLQVDQSVTGTSLNTKPPILALVCRCWLSIEIHSLNNQPTKLPMRGDPLAHSLPNKQTPIKGKLDSEDISRASPQFVA